LLSESDANLAELFLKNARSAARLRHRNIVKVHDAGQAGGTAYVAMELAEGESLRNLLDKQPLPVARAIQIFDDIASALAYAHEEGIVHRGVRPSNVIVLRSGVAKIGDFGIGQIGEAALRYKSPEQVRRDPVDHRSDLFSLGAVVYEMLTRRAPFEGSSPKEIIENTLHAKPPRPSEVNPHVPGALDGIVCSMLAWRPDERFANARILLRDLQRLEEGLGLGPGTGAGTGEPTASVPAGRAEPTLRTAAANQSREREVPREASLPPRGQTEPAAPQPAAKREPTLRTLDPDRLRDHAPMQDAPRFGALDEHDARFMMDRQPDPERSSASRAARFAALSLMVAVLFGVVVHYWPRPSEPRPRASGMQEAPARSAAPSQTTVPTAVAEATKEPAEPLVAEPNPPAKSDMQEAQAPAPAPFRSTAPPPVAEAPKEPVTAPASAPKSSPPKALVAEPSPPAQTEVARAAQPAAKISVPQPGGTARLILAVSPQGELWIDGKHHGTTPPITTLDLEPGMHRIEIRSGSLKPFLTYMAVEAGDQRRIRHDFGAKPSRPPT
jgi:serine/threonine-protein kinase